MSPLLERMALAIARECENPDERRGFDRFRLAAVASLIAIRGPIPEQMALAAKRAGGRWTDETPSPDDIWKHMIDWLLARPFGNVGQEGPSIVPPLVCEYELAGERIGLRITVPNSEEMQIAVRAISQAVNEAVSVALITRIASPSD